MNYDLSMQNIQIIAMQHAEQNCILCCASSLSRVRLFATPWAVARQAPPSMGLSRQGYWSGLPCPPPGNLPNPGIEARSPALQADSLPSEPPGKTRNSGVTSLSLLHCRWILYQLSYPGSLNYILCTIKTNVFYFFLTNVF